MSYWSSEELFQDNSDWECELGVWYAQRIFDIHNQCLGMSEADAYLEACEQYSRFLKVQKRRGQCKQLLDVSQYFEQAIAKPDALKTK